MMPTKASQNKGTIVQNSFNSRQEWSMRLAKTPILSLFLQCKSEIIHGHPIKLTDIL